MKKRVWFFLTVGLYILSFALMQAGIIKTFFPPMPWTEVAWKFPLHFTLCGAVSAFAIWRWKR